LLVVCTEKLASTCRAATLSHPASLPLQNTMGHQAAVKETYLRVIEATLAGSKAELEEEGETNEILGATFDKLRERWTARLLDALDFTEDPTATVRGTTARNGGNRRPSAASAAARAAAAASASPVPDEAVGPADAAAQNESLSHKASVPRDSAVSVPPDEIYPALISTSANPGLVAYTPQHDLAQQHPVTTAPLSANDPGVYSAANLFMPEITESVGYQAQLAGRIPPVSSAVPPHVLAPLARPTFPPQTYPGADSSPGTVAGSENVPQGDGDGDVAATTPTEGDVANRDGDGSGGTPPAKRVRHDEKVNDNEDLGSDDSGDESTGGSDGDFDNYILAQHDSVKKGSGSGKWKVRLKDGIMHLNGRDYLFSKATGDLYFILDLLHIVSGLLRLVFVSEIPVTNILVT
jgi:hypothetical protein